MPEALCVYMEPSSPALLRARYEQSCRSGFEVEVRMELAERQRAQSGFCDCRIPSDEPEAAVRALNALLDGE